VVGLLLRLHWRLTVRQIRSSPLILVSTILTGLAVVPMAALLFYGLVWLRGWPENRVLWTVLGFAGLTLAWPLMTLFVTGSNDLLDIGRFALYPVRAAQLVPGLLMTGLLGFGGLLTLVLGAGYVIAWSTALDTALLALLGAVLGTVVCVLSTRSLSAALSGLFQRRRLRELALVVVFVVIIGASVAVQMASRWLGEGNVALADVTALARRVEAVVVWTPLGWPWAIPASAAAGRWDMAVLQTVYALCLIALLAWIWGRQVSRGLTSPLDAGGGGMRIRGGNLFDHVLPYSPPGAIARRGVRYLRRDPRRLLGLLAMLVLPLLVIVALLTVPAGLLPAGARTATIAFAPALMAWLTAALVSTDICYDGSALGTQILIGTSGRDDRLGRALGFLVVLVPLQVAAIVGLIVWSGRWDLLPGTAGLAAALLLGGVGIGSWAGAIWQYAQPPPGGNLTARGATGGVAALISGLIGMLVPLLIALPTLALVVLGMRTGRLLLGWAGLLVGVLTGVGTLAWGVRAGGRRLDAHWPDVLERVTWKG